MIRILFFATLEMVAPLHIGSGKKDDPLSDNPVMRNTAGMPFIPGGSLSGLFARILDEKQKIDLLGYPSSHKKGDNKPSRVTFDDALPIPQQQYSILHPVDVRTSVTIKRDTLTAKQNHLFQSEVLPVGTRFCFSCRFDAENEEQASEFRELVNTFLNMSPPLGGKTNSGKGQWKADEFHIARFDLSTPEGVREWVLKGHGFNWTGDPSTLDFSSKEKNIPVQNLGDERWRVRIQAEIDGLHLVAAMSGVPVKESPDIEQATRQRIDDQGVLQPEYVDFGSSVKGQLRTIMEMILRTHLKSHGLSKKQVEQELIPDPAPGQKDPKSKWVNAAQFFGSTEKKGGFRACEMVWHDADISREDHIRLCEFTQQTISGAKFEFAPLCKGRSELEISVPKDSPDWQKELLSHAAILLSLDILPFGGHASRGYLGAKFSSPEYPDGKPAQGELKSLVESRIHEKQEAA
ncbi:protein of unknown function DUF324 [Desulfonatronospira thiodismutans ASO3-1]|uniref:CRISPR type III-associated protein domain-containing protein n=1 Tax=Desulfonatronospira thiodismutans ASO3-1 TaxID=555779 RepID=D6SPT8_9BACT|nr:RAMP superfamily CRISPR-associated protein [Desulfonatronospira thiodismutans]EFI34764.1 protein of unknown function DUF324 [Desulfonatronospira thiodismutans ASO3-1]